MSAWRAEAPPDGSAAAGVYLIGCGAAADNDNNNNDSDTAAAPTPAQVGFKAYNLLRMAELGLPVPPAFVLGTGFCAPQRRAQAGDWRPALRRLEAASGLGFGDARRPLLLSVRSGAPVSMPGMMETLLNVGLSERTLPGLVAQTGNPRLAWDAYRRLVACFGEVVAQVPAALFEAELARLAGGRDERELDFAQLRELTRRFLAVYRDATGTPFPQEPDEQLGRAVAAVFDSWQAPRARDYRRLNNIDDAVGTAVTAQAMVFGNAGGMSGAGVGFSRDPVSGAPALWLDFLFNAQGEDVVSGRRSAHGHEALAGALPEVWDQLGAAARQIERAFGDMQDFEFTVQRGRLFMLQARAGKRSARAAARIALDLFDEGVIERAEACRRTAGLDEQALTLRRVAAADGAAPPAIASASVAGGGVASGAIALDEARARAERAAGRAVILLRRDAETADIGALALADGLLTERGARTSHAAVVARQMGKVCLVACAGLRIDEAARQVTLGGLVLREGELITLDGNEGLVYAGAVGLVSERPLELLARLADLRG
ncbi:PEP/pyruvate-binding domain-containing protein [Rugamonas rubra]|uniref:Pyruvate phosphate dikinase n=1 Tax=Rugamonas rubra TaxID=758825 RepID=A0A1I4KAV1_9BURK|nr:PEP/pyruvate-binding domain-containing protein [Rugamonas rubra]SFL75962.1 pyruvate phosphate dikinase [Rugamonas rubra]